MQKLGRGMTAGLTLPILAGGAMIVKAFDQVDDAFDLIRAKTGATGKDLKGLEKDFQAVAKSTPATMERAAAVLAEVRSNLGHTGKSLQDLTKQILEAGRITDQGEIAVEDITRVYGDWSVATDRQSLTLDKFFRASQLGGGRIDALAQKVVQFGAPLRTLGFNLETSIAMFTRFQKEGVNTETVMAGLRKFIAGAAAEGKNAAIEFPKVIQQIRELTAAGKDAEAMDLGRQMFGTKTFQDVTRAIQEGRFEFGGLVTDINAGKDTILGVADATKDWRERWQETKNAASLALAPLAETILPTISRILKEDVVPALEKFAAWWKTLSPDTQENIVKFAGLVAVIGPMAGILGTIAKVLATVAGGIVGAVAAGILLGVLIDKFNQKYFPGFRDFLGEIGSFLLAPIALLGRWSTGLDVVKSDLENLKDVAARVFNAIAEKLNFMIDIWNRLPGPDIPNIPTWNPRANTLAKNKAPGKGSIPKMAKGGWVLRPTVALLGEAGPELVTPKDEVGAMGSQTMINVYPAESALTEEGLFRIQRRYELLKSLA